jgi:transposase-like protein
MMPPNNESVSQLSKELGITEPTLYKWRKEARIAVNPTPGEDKVLNNGAVKISSW